LAFDLYSSEQESISVDSTNMRILQDLLAVGWPTSVLYVIVGPVAMKRRKKLRRGRDPALNSYLDTYADGERHRSFWYGAREYSEIPIGRVEWLGDLNKVIRLLAKTQISPPVPRGELSPQDLPTHDLHWRASSSR
jgi:hypothetical protein